MCLIWSYLAEPDDALGGEELVLEAEPVVGDLVIPVEAAPGFISTDFEMVPVGLFGSFTGVTFLIGLV